MRFWKDNRIDGEHMVPDAEIVAAFWASPRAKEWRKGNGPILERVLVGFLMDEGYGSWDPKSEEYRNLFNAVYAAMDSNQEINSMTNNTYCDDCGNPVPDDEQVWVGELQVSIESANLGESAVLCDDCGRWYQRLLKQLTLAEDPPGKGL